MSNYILWSVRLDIMKKNYYLRQLYLPFDESFRVINSFIVKQFQYLVVALKFRELL